MEHFGSIFTDTDWIILETIKELEEQIGSNRESTTRLRGELAELNKLSTGFGKLMLDPSLSAGAKSEIDRQLDEVASKRITLQRSLDQMAERSNRGAERLIAETRRALDDAKTSLTAIATPEETHAFIDRFVGPSVATADGRLLAFGAETTVGTGEKAGAHSNIAATGVEPVTLGL